MKITHAHTTFGIELIAEGIDAKEIDAAAERILADAARAMGRDMGAALFCTSSTAQPATLSLDTLKEMHLKMPPRFEYRIAEGSRQSFEAALLPVLFAAAFFDPTSPLNTGLAADLAGYGFPEIPIVEKPDYLPGTGALVELAPMADFGERVTDVMLLVWVDGVLKCAKQQKQKFYTNYGRNQQ